MLFKLSRLAARYKRTLLVCLTGTMLSFNVAAQPEIDSITLVAPDTVSELLKNHFELPTTPLPDETDRASFMRRARQEIGELLATEGYFSPLLTMHRAEQVWVVEVNPGSRTKVTQLRLEFKGELALDSARIAKLKTSWLMPPATVFRSAAWEEAKTALLLGVTQEDYAAAKIVLSQAQVDPLQESADLTVVIDSGSANRFGELQVSGLERYPKSLVSRAAPFHAGEPYRRNLLMEFQARLQNMPQFASALVNIEPGLKSEVPVQVTLVEAKPRRMALGAGYSTNNGARSEINYLDHHFLAQAWNLNSSLRLEEKRQTLTAGIDALPDDKGYVMSWGASGETTQIEGLKTASSKLGLTRSRTVAQLESRIGVNWLQESRKPAAGIQQVNQALVPDWQWLRRSVDDPMYPRRGEVSELRIGGGRRQLLSDQDFVRGYVRHQLWQPLGERDVLSLRGEAGFTAARSRLGIPQEFLFRAGGSQSVRGYAYQSLGVQEGAAVVGGRVMSTGSIEYTHWLSRDWGMACFTDAGGAADVVHDLHLAAAYGSGVRWRSPAGPLALDLAWGRESHALRLHFSIAAAF